MKLEFCRQIFRKTLSIKFDENPSSGAELSEAYGWTDTNRHDEAENRISQVRKRA